jgi:hypothetical protein
MLLTVHYTNDYSHTIVHSQLHQTHNNSGCHWCHEFQANHEIRVCDRCDAFYCRACDEMDQCEDCSEVVCNTCSTLMSCKFCGCGLCEDCATACGRCVGYLACTVLCVFALFYSLCFTSQQFITTSNTYTDAVYSSVPVTPNSP